MGSYAKIGSNSNGYLRMNFFKSNNTHEKNSVFSSNERNSAGLTWSQSCDNADENSTSNRDEDNRLDSDNETTSAIDESLDSVFI